MLEIDINSFIRHIKSKNFFEIKKSILIAVSGGIDSMVLLHLMQHADYHIFVAHIDHNTRNGQSTKDAEFVEKYCKNNGITFHKTTFIHNSTTRGNFHQKAHNFRYKFFESLGYDYILTAHHNDDHIETILLNLFNGKSIKGIPEINGNIVRPLLAFSKESIIRYATENNVSYIEDSSNSTDIYDRNYIRNKVLPILNEKFVHLSQKLMSLAHRNQEDIALLESLVKNNILKENQNKSVVSIDRCQFNGDSTLLYHCLKEYGFNRCQAFDIIKTQGNTGSTFYSKSYTLLLDRSRLLIAPSEDGLYKKDSFISVNLSQLPANIEFIGYNFYFEKTDQLDEFSKNILYLPWNLLGEEILIRTWRDGDFFLPYGMNGKKKTLKKFFVDNKINRIEKHRTPILTNNEEILWIANHRSDHRYRYTEKDQDFLKVTLLL